MKSIGALIFPEFELLDMFGPLEMFGMLPDAFEIQMVAESGDPVASAQGPRIVIDATMGQARGFDLLLVPGGAGTRREISNRKLLDWIARTSARAEITMSVCTGSVLLAGAGLLDGKRATTNKRAFDWVRAQRPAVRWISRARWVQDNNVFTSSGVSAGMDMSLAVIAALCGLDTAKQVCVWAEYQWNEDPDWDPFAFSSGLTT